MQVCISNREGQLWLTCMLFSSWSQRPFFFSPQRKLLIGTSLIVAVSLFVVMENYSEKLYFPLQPMFRQGFSSHWMFSKQSYKDFKAHPGYVSIPKQEVRSRFLHLQIKTRRQSSWTNSDFATFLLTRPMHTHTCWGTGVRFSKLLLHKTGSSRKLNQLLSDPSHGLALEFKLLLFECRFRIPL